ncbi:CHASE domain-containing sensor histidine kinase [Nodosilinea nodulosa]|uniref:CHASE domain-containing sensor histidine kinase n=1 Tax=Nodosilinea nodulosa TaxID=416001 RepID=UPI0004749ACD|nr:CHASE domain-containing protein [Nodosilinea nodulosa]
MSFRSRHLPFGLILALGLGTTLAATFWVGRWERLSRQSEFQKQINNLTTALQRTTNRYNELLLSVGDLYSANAQAVTEPAFSRFVQRAIATYPGIQALEWAPLLSQRDRTAYEQWLQTRTRQPELGITERNAAGNLVRASERSSYVPVTFLEPWQTNEAALGYDLASDSTRRIALERARDTGEMAATGRIQLVQDRAENQYSFLVFLPVYRQSAISLTQRRQRLQGYILGVFRVADVVEESLTDLDYDVDFYILDRTAKDDEQLLGFYDAEKQQVVSDWGKGQFPVGRSGVEIPSPALLCAPGLSCTATLSLGQREWQLLFLPPRYPALPWAALATALIGLLLTTVLLVYLTRWQSELRRSRELSDLKLRLFSMASHELRTPLSVISVSAQSLGANRDSLTPQQQTTVVERIQLAARRMGQLVEDILMLTRAEAGKLEVNPEILELGLFCRQVCDQIQLLPGQTLLLEGQDLEVKVYFDKKLLQSVLTNLLSNAVKYSPPGCPIRLVVTATAETWTFQVIDRGIGIPTAAQGHIFEAFYRGDNVGQVQGTGLGLAVAKTCVELMAGHLTVQSEPTGGTCIAAVLPRVH